LECFEERTIVLPSWCRIGVLIYWSSPKDTGYKIVEERIISYGDDGFFHHVHNSKVFFTPFSEYGKTVFLTREEAEKAIPKTPGEEHFYFAKEC